MGGIECGRERGGGEVRGRGKVWAETVKRWVLLLKLYISGSGGLSSDPERRRNWDWDWDWVGLGTRRRRDVCPCALHYEKEASCDVIWLGVDGNEGDEQQHTTWKTNTSVLTCSSYEVVEYIQYIQLNTLMTSKSPLLTDSQPESR